MSRPDRTDEAVKSINYAFQEPETGLACPWSSDVFRLHRSMVSAFLIDRGNTFQIPFFPANL